MIINNAGYMWNRKYVDWSKRHLFGSPDRGGGDEQDFADQTGVYGLYSGTHECIYIGQAGQGDSSALFDRLKAHALKTTYSAFGNDSRGLDSTRRTSYMMRITLILLQRI